MIEHGGNIDRAITIYGGKKKEWIDLSTGINPECYPIPNFSDADWRNLPTFTEIENLEFIIKSIFNTFASVMLTPGSQIAISLLPLLLKKQDVCILEPTYGDYTESFINAGFKVRSCKDIQELFKSKIAIIVNPNNPDGKNYRINDLILLSKKVNILIIDESFVEASETKSILGHINKKTSNIIVIKSFGKVYGLAGLRLGFVFSGEGLIDKFKRIFSFWPVSTVAIKIASKALTDKEWIKSTQAKLKKKSYVLDNIMKTLHFELIGGTNLFRLYLTPNAKLAQIFLAKKFIWSRIFSYSEKWLRLGIPCDRNLKKLQIKLKV